MKKLLLILIISINMYGYTFEEGLKEFESNNYKKAFKIFNEFANKGNKKAKLILAKMYMQGIGVKQDTIKAKNILNELTSNTNEDLQVALRALYGGFIEKDYKRSVELLEPLAKKGNLVAQFTLGDMYFQGSKIKGDSRKALEFLLPLAKKGVSDAQYKVGVLYMSEKNYKEAFKWLNQSYKNGIINTHINVMLGILYKNGQGVNRNYKKALTLLLPLAEKGNPTAQTIVGEIYSEVQNYKEAVKWYELASKQGNVVALNNLSSLYYDGKGGLKKDRIKAKKLLELSAAQGFKDAQENLVKFFNDYSYKNTSSRTLTKKGEKLYFKCIRCHGANGKTKALGKSAIIAGQNRDSLVKKLFDYKLGKRNKSGMGSLMRGQVSKLNKQDIEALANYISTL